MTNQKGWLRYYENRGTKPRSEVIESIKYVQEPCDALDLGSGAFVESKYLLGNGFSVLAVDPEEGLKSIARELASERFNFECSKIEDFNFPLNVFGFVCANYSLPFIPKSKIQRVFRSIRNSMQNNGILCLQLFGINDGLNKRWRSTAFYSEDEVIHLIEKFEILNIDSLEGFRKLADGRTNYSHVFKLILKK